MIATPARGRQQVRAQMRGKGLQDWMRPALPPIELSAP